MTGGILTTLGSSFSLVSFSDLKGESSDKNLPTFLSDFLSLFLILPTVYFLRALKTETKNLTI